MPKPKKPPRVDDHWKAVVRDAFIDGRDDEAIDLLLSNIVGWVASRQRTKKIPIPKKGQHFPDTIFVMFDPNDGDDLNIMLVEENVDSIADGTRVGTYSLDSIKIKRVIGTLEDR